MTEVAIKCNHNESRIVEITLQVAAKRLAAETGVSELNASTMLSDCAMGELSTHAPFTTPEYLRALADKLEDRANGIIGVSDGRRKRSIDAVSAEIIKNARGAVH